MSVSVRDSAVRIASIRRVRWDAVTDALPRRVEKGGGGGGTGRRNRTRGDATASQHRIYLHFAAVGCLVQRRLPILMITRTMNQDGFKSNKQNRS